MTEHDKARAARDVPPGALADADLEAAIAAQKEAIAAFEHEFVPLRRRYERLRGRLRDLEAERERRRLAAAGQQAVFKPIPRRSITVADVVAGRERAVPMDVPLSRFTFTSVRRQPIVLHPAGDREQASAGRGLDTGRPRRGPQPHGRVLPGHRDPRLAAPGSDVL
jgi:hypothetical protein